MFRDPPVPQFLPLLPELEDWEVNMLDTLHSYLHHWLERIAAYGPTINEGLCSYEIGAYLKVGHPRAVARRMSRLRNLGLVCHFTRKDKPPSDDLWVITSLGERVQQELVTQRLVIADAIDRLTP